MPDTLREIQKSGLPHCSRRFVLYITQSSGVQGDLVRTWFFVLPIDVATDATGNVYIADWINARILVVDGSGHNPNDSRQTVVSAITETACLRCKRTCSLQVWRSMQQGNCTSRINSNYRVRAVVK